MALTQARGYAAHTGRRYGNFNRGRSVDALTQPSAFGSHTHTRYKSFAGKATSGPQHPVGKLTQLRAFGAHTGQRYGAFSGRVPPIPPVPPSQPIGGRRIQLPSAFIDQLRLQRIDEDDILLIIAAQISTGQLY